MRPAVLSTALGPRRQRDAPARPPAAADRRRRAPWADRRGATALEFALVSPILILLLFGIIVYGGYFLVAHSVQEVADDAARASIAGLTDTERQSLAATAMANDLQAYNYLQDPGSTASSPNPQLTYQDQNQTITVTVSYNAARSPFWALSGLVPMPSSTLVKSAAVQIGGY